MDWLKEIEHAIAADKGNLTFTFVLFALILGCIVSWILIFYERKVIGAMVRALQKGEHIGEEKAVSIESLGQSFNVSAIKRLERYSALSKVVGVKGSEMPMKGKRSVTTESEIFLFENAGPRADRQYSEKGTSLPVLVAGILGILVAGILTFLIYNALKG